MARWTLDDIPWHRFDAAKLDPELVRLVKAASLVEANGAAYAHHLCRVFEDDPGFQAVARHWGEEEVQHGAALGRWAALADPGFDFTEAFARFRAGYRVDFDSARSRRGSRSGEMVARCMVETGTSTYYAALSEAAEEPVLREICRRIADDEVRHYKLFHRNLRHCLDREGVGFWRRLMVAGKRIAEVGDNELAWAYHAANETGLPYNRRRCARAYAGRAYALYRARHVTRGVALIFKALGLAPKGRLARATSRLVWAVMRRRAVQLAAAEP
jgi:hypothetical protein